MNYPDYEFRKAAVYGQVHDSPPANGPQESAITMEQQIALAQRELDRLKELSAVAQQRDEVFIRISNELALAEATQVLLNHIRQLVVDQARSVNGSKALAHFIKELQPLAQTYGVKIVKIGDGSQATITRIKG